MARHMIKSALELKSLVATAVDEARAKQTRVRVNDGEGLRVEATAAGSTSWQVLYRMPGRSERPFTIGKYPAIGLKDARELADKVRLKVAQGIDPNDEKKVARSQEQAEAAKTTGMTVTEVLEAYLLELQPRYAQRSLTTMGRAFNFNVIPYVGKRVAKTLTPEDVEELLRRVEARGSHETRRRLTTWLADAFTNAKIKPNPFKAVDDDEYKKPVPSTTGHPGATDPKTFAQVLRSIAGFKGSTLTRTALMLHAHIFVRPDELRLANWDQVRGDLMHVTVVLAGDTFEHLVPLTPQARALFDELRPMHKTFVLPGRSYNRRMSDSTLGAALIALGWRDIQTPHGFRKSASTLLNEMGWDSRHVDMQLSHKLKTKGSESIYNKAKYLQQRIPMMACWSDYIDALLDPTSGADEMLPLRWREAWDAAQRKSDPKVA